MENVLFDFIAQYMPLNEAEKQAIIDLGIFKSYKKGHLLLKEGALSQESYFVIKGCLRCYYDVDGAEKTSAFFTESESITPLCVTTKKPSEYYLACVEDSIILVSNPAMEREVFEKFPRFETLCRLLSEDLLAQNQASFEFYKNSTAEQRYLHLLETRPGLFQRVPLHQLASYLGIQAESLSRIRRRLQKKGKA